MTHALRKFIHNSFFVVLPTVLVCLIILEGGLRLSGRKPWSGTDGVFEQAGSSYRLKRSYTRNINAPSYRYAVHINALGFRDRTPGLREIAKPYIVFLGESNTFGNGVNYEDTFAGRMGAMAGERDMEVVNLAVGGHRLVDQLEFLEDFVQIVDRTPSLVVMCYSAQFLTGFYGSYSDIIVKGGFLFSNKNWLIPYIRVQLENNLTSFCFLNDKLRAIVDIPSRKRQSTLNALSYYSKRHNLYDPEILRQAERTLAGLDTYLRETGTAALYINLPPSTEFILSNLLEQAGAQAEDYDFDQYGRFLEDHCRDHNIRHLDLFPVLKDQFQQGARLSYENDPHYNSRAHAIIADAISRSIDMSSPGN